MLGLGLGPGVAGVVGVAFAALFATGVAGNDALVAPAAPADGRGELVGGGYNPPIIPPFHAHALPYWAWSRSRRR